MINIGEFGNNGIRESETKTEPEDNTHITRTMSEDSEDTVEDENNSDEDEIDEDDNGDGPHEPSPKLRRSTRLKTKPAYLNDFALLAETEYERLLMVINEEPLNFQEARELKIWIEACEEELSSIEKNRTWTLVDLPVGTKPIGLKWVFKIKRNSDGSINKYKARLVAK